MKCDSIEWHSFKAGRRHFWPDKTLVLQVAQKKDQNVGFGGTTTVCAQVQVGSRLPVHDRCEEVDSGNALHAVFAAVLQGCRTDMADLGPMAQKLIAAHGTSGSLGGTELVAAATRLRTVLDAQFAALKILVEVPFEFAMEDGTRSTGFIDLAVETASGWIIVDHKPFQGNAAQCEKKGTGILGTILALPPRLGCIRC